MAGAAGAALTIGGRFVAGGMAGFNVAGGLFCVEVMNEASSSIERRSRDALLQPNRAQPASSTLDKQHSQPIDRTTLTICIAFVAVKVFHRPRTLRGSSRADGTRCEL